MLAFALVAVASAHAFTFMDYTDDDCMFEFTAGQTDRMDAQWLGLTCEVDTCGEAWTGECVATRTDGERTETLPLDMTFEPVASAVIISNNAPGNFNGTWQEVFDDVLLAGARFVLFGDPRADVEVERRIVSSSFNTAADPDLYLYDFGDVR